MIQYLLRRLVSTLPVVLFVAVATFFLARLGPSDPAVLIAGDFANDETLQRIRESLGLNESLFVQFFTWLRNVLQGDFGNSIYSGLPVWTLIKQRLEPTLALALGTMTFSVVVAVPMGIVAAWRVNTWVDRLVMLLSVLAFSLPVFVIAYFLVFVFALELNWLPVQGFARIRQGLGPFLRQLVLPVVSIGSIYVALIARITRASLLGVLGEDYIRTAKAKGLSTYRVLVTHGARSAAVPIITVIGVGFALLIAGVVVTESVFVIPGLGRLTADSILTRDFPVIQALMLLFSIVYVVVNLVVDIAYAFFDPRIRFGK